jgi:hypothetical protein
MLSLDKVMPKKEVTRGKPVTCNEYGVALRPLHEDVCDRCGDGVVILECPSCLDQDEYVTLSDSGDDYDARLVGRCHGKQGRLVTEMELAALCASTVGAKQNIDSALSTPLHAPVAPEELIVRAVEVGVLLRYPPEGLQLGPEDGELPLDGVGVDISPGILSHAVVDGLVPERAVQDAVRAEIVVVDCGVGLDITHSPLYDLPSSPPDEGATLTCFVSLDTIPMIGGLSR